MFKKKPKLPLRPKCPTTNQMIEDLSVVADDDPIFTTAKIFLQNCEDFRDASDCEKAYTKIEQFFDAHQTLKDLMKNLSMASSSLNEKECDMMKMAEELKNQAIKALI